MVDSTKNKQQEEKKGVDLSRKVTIEPLNIHQNIKAKKLSAFVNSKKEWSAYNIPEDLIKGIKEVLFWDYPSRIQSTAIPYITEQDEETKEFEHLIA